MDATAPVQVPVALAVAGNLLTGFMLVALIAGFVYLTYVRTGCWDRALRNADKRRARRTLATEAHARLNARLNARTQATLAPVTSLADARTRRSDVDLIA